MKLVFADAAKSDLKSIFDYIVAENPSAAERVLHGLVAASGALKEFPQMGKPGRVTDTRELVVADMPYVLVYRVTPDSVVILAVFHGSRDIVQEMQERKK